MSTKLHHGYRLAAGTDLFAFAAKLRTALNPVRDRLDATWLMNHACHLVDLADRDNQPRPASPLMRALDDYDAKQKKLTSNDHGHDPHRFEVAFLHDPLDEAGPGTGRILALLYCEAEPLRTAWSNLDEVEHYGYWNNTDAPEDLSETDWDERRETWQRVLPGFDAPVLHSLTFQLRPEPPHETGMLMLALAARHFDTNQNSDAHRVQLLRDCAPDVRRRAGELATHLLTTIRFADTEPEPREVFSFISHIRNDRRRHPAAFEDLLDACEQPLHTDVIDYVLAGNLTAEPPTRGIDLSGARAAATAWINRAAAVADND